MQRNIQETCSLCKGLELVPIYDPELDVRYLAPCPWCVHPVSEEDEPEYPVLGWVIIGCFFVTITTIIVMSIVVL
jgi:hypothetical protein